MRNYECGWCVAKMCEKCSGTYRVKVSPNRIESGDCICPAIYHSAESVRRREVVQKAAVAKLQLAEGRAALSGSEPQG
jgi:hypothetical protein